MAKLLDFQKTTLKNGLRVITAFLPWAQSVVVSVFIGAGSRYESEKHNGLAHFLEHMLFQGTQKYPTKKILSEVIESVGGQFNGSTGKESSHFWAKVAHPHLENALDVLSQMLIFPQFEKERLEQVKKIITEEIHRKQDDPVAFLQERFIQTMWPNQPLGRSNLGKKETIKTFTREILLSFHQKFYTAGNIVLAVVGNFDKNQALQVIEKYFAFVPGGERLKYSKAIEDQKQPQAYFKKQKVKQNHLVLGFRGFSYFHPDRYVLNVLCTLLGRGKSSRLYEKIREKIGLAYSISASFWSFTDTGVLSVYAGLNPAKSVQALQTILEELENLKAESVTKEELSKAKEREKVPVLFTLESTKSLAAALASQELLKSRIETPEEYIEKIDAVSIRDVRRVANELFVDDRLNLTMLGPIGNQKKLMESLSLK